MSCVPTRIFEQGDRCSAKRFYSRGFTIIELLVATAVLALILGFVLSSVSNVSGIWRRSTDKVKSFQEARLAFETITRTLSQATLNTYLDYDSQTSAKRYLRQSDLKFLIGNAGATGIPGTAGCGQAVFFQAPIGYASGTAYQNIGSLLNTCGFYVTLTTNSTVPQHASSTANPARYRLMQMLVPTEKNDVYTSSGSSWFSSYVNEARPIADNVIAIVLRPQDPATLISSPNSSPNDAYSYDSTAGALNNPQPITANQLPPVVQVTLIAIDETSAKRTEGASVVSSALNGKFTIASAYDADLKSVENALSTANINYRVFSSAVPIRESKWTK